MPSISPSAGNDLMGTQVIAVLPGLARELAQMLKEISGTAASTPPVVRYKVRNNA
jgi:hypothetical protein